MRDVQSVYKNKVIGLGTLPSGKEIGYREIGKNCFKEICFKDGGQVPGELGGVWTDIMQMKAAVNSYIVKQEQSKKADKGK